VALALARAALGSAQAADAAASVVL
jgi:hypothetical protein